MSRLLAVLAAVALASGGGVGARPPAGPTAGASLARPPVPLPAATTAPSGPVVAPPTTVPPTTATPTTASSAPLASTAPPAPAAPPTSSDCPLRRLPPAAPADDVATAFVMAYGTVAAAEDPAIRLGCLRSRLADPLGSPMLTPPSFTPEQIGTHWRLDPTAPPALAVDQDSPQAATRLVLTATLRAQVSADGVEPVGTVSQLLLELISSSGRWLVATMSSRSVPP